MRIPSGAVTTQLGNDERDTRIQPIICYDNTVLRGYIQEHATRIMTEGYVRQGYDHLDQNVHNIEVIS